jgi:thymidylate synthase
MSNNIAIATGWTIASTVSKHLDPSSYFVIKELYSCTPGINLLVRNLLANTTIRYLFLLKASKYDLNSGSIDCVLDFFAKGVQLGKTNGGRTAWIVDSKYTAYIDAEIPSIALDSLRMSVQVYEFQDISSLVEKVKSFSDKTSNPWASPMIFPEHKPVNLITPGQLNGHRIESRFIHEAWVKILHRVRSNGKISVSSSDILWQELLNVITVITDEPEDLIFPEPNYLPIDNFFIEKYVYQMLNGGDNSSSYGTRMISHFGINQVESIVNNLKNNRISNRLVINLWDVQSDIKSPSPPCLNHVWVKIYDNQLYMTATFRSNDMFSAWTSNAMGLRKLQYHIFNQIKEYYLDVKMGSLSIISESAHIYEDSWTAADDIIQCHYQRIVNRKVFEDPVGNFVIRIDDNAILVTHVTKDGEQVAKYTGKSATLICNKIVANNPSILPGHAAYLGIELNRAENSLLFGKTYSQF